MNDGSDPIYYFGGQSPNRRLLMVHEACMHKIRSLLQKLADNEIWFVGFLAIASLIYERLLLVCVLVAIGFWIIRWVSQGYPSTRTPADLSILLLMLALPVTLWVTPLPHVTQPQILRLLSGIVLYYAIVNWANSIKRIRLAIVLVTFTGIFLSVYALISVEWAAGKWLTLLNNWHQYLTPLVTDTVNPNVMAGNIVLILPVAISGLLAGWEKNTWLYRVLFSAGTLIITGVLVLTLSRGALIAMAIALMVFIVIRWKWGWVFVAIVSIGVVFALFRIGSYPLLEALLSGTSVGSLEARVQLWSRALLIASTFPFTGIGMGMTNQVINQLFPLLSQETIVIAHVHNLFLQILVDLGIGGLIGWLATLILAIYLAWRLFIEGSKSNSRRGWIAGIGAGLLCSQIALIVHGLTDSVTWGMVRPAPLVWVLWGLIMACGNAYSKCGDK